MRILEINKFNFVKGGADKHFLDLVELLQQKGHEVAIFSMQHPQNKDTRWSRYFVSNVDYSVSLGLWESLRSVGKIFWSFEARKKISSLLDEFQPEIVHIHNIYHQISPSILREIKGRGIPIVMTVHDWKLICPNYLMACRGRVCTECVAGSYWRCVKHKCIKNSYLKSAISAAEMHFHKWIRVYEKNIDLYIVPSIFVKEKLVADGFPEDKVQVLPHFIPNDEIGRSEEDSTLSTDDQKPYALYLGRIAADKGADELIEIFRDLDLELHLAGSRDPEFQAEIPENVKELGFLSGDRLNSEIRGASLLVSASKLPETFGLIALEALANRKPFVGYATGAYSEVIKNDQNGFLVKSKKEFSEKVIKCLKNKEIFSFDVSKYDSGRYGEKLVDIFKKML